MLKLHPVFLVMFFIGVGPVACGGDEEPVTPATVTQMSSELITDSVANTVNGVASIGTAMDNNDFEVVSALEGALLALGDGFNPFESEDTTVVRSLEDEGYVDEQADEPFRREEFEDDLGEWLEEHVFNERNLEAAGEDWAVFLLHGDTLCEPRQECSSDGNCQQVMDEACIEDIDDLEIRIRVTIVGESGLNIEPLVGPMRYAPLLLEFRTDGMAVELDIGAAAAAVEHIARVLDEQEPDLPQVLRGRLRAALKINGNEDITLSASVLNRIEFQVDLDEGSVVASAEISDPLVSLRIQGEVPRVSVAVDVNALALSVPWVFLSDDPQAAGDLHVNLGGLSFAFALEEIMDSLTIEGIGLGEIRSTIMKDAELLLGLDLNEASGRTLDFTITPEGVDNAVFSVFPELALELYLGLGKIPYEMADAPAFMMDETYSIRLGGEQGASVLPVEPDGLGWQGGFKLLTGSLEIASDAPQPGGTTIQVSTGQCLTSTTPEGDLAHELLDHFLASDCP